MVFVVHIGSRDHNTYGYAGMSAEHCVEGRATHIRGKGGALSLCLARSAPLLPCLMSSGDERPRGMQARSSSAHGLELKA